MAVADRTGGAEGNERLTAAAGAALLVLLAAEGVTILAVRRLLTLHFLIGMLLIGPVILKISSTGYRFVRYYVGSRRYRRRGPPALPLRILGPLVLASTVAVLGSGVALAAEGPGHGGWLFIHKAAFALWFCATTLHVLWYAPRLPRLLAAEVRGRAGARTACAAPRGRGLRWFLLALALAAGLIIAGLTVHLTSPWQAGGAAG